MGGVCGSLLQNVSEVFLTTLSPEGDLFIVGIGMGNQYSWRGKGKAGRKEGADRNSQSKPLDEHIM